MQGLLSREADTATFAGGLDAGVKLALCLLGSLSSILLSSPLSLGLLLIFVTALALSSVRPLTLLRVYLAATAFMGVTLAFTALLGLAVPGLMRWNPISLGVPYLRMMVSVNLLLTLAVSTPVQTLFSRLQRMRLPRVIRIPISVSIRFIPVFMDDCGQIRDASRLRPGRGVAGAWRTLAVPLIFRVLFSADDLAMSAELKGIGQSVPLPKEESRFAPSNYLVLALAALILISALLLQFYGPQFASLKHG